MEKEIKINIIPVLDSSSNGNIGRLRNVSSIKTGWAEMSRTTIMTFPSNNSDFFFTDAINTDVPPSVS